MNHAASARTGRAHQRTLQLPHTCRQACESEFPGGQAWGRKAQLVSASMVEAVRLGPLGPFAADVERSGRLETTHHRWARAFLAAAPSWIRVLASSNAIAAEFSHVCKARPYALAL